MVRRTKDRLRHARRGITALTVAVLTVLGALVALADHPDGSGFNIDGTVPDGGAANFTDPSGNVKELGPENSNTTKLGVIHNDALPTLAMSNPNGQVDLENVWFDTNTAGGKDWLYFGWERDSTTGSGVIAIEFQKNAAPAACDYSASDATLIANCNPWANRDDGDFLLIWDQVGNTVQISVRTFNGTAFGPSDPLDAHEFKAVLSSDTSRGEAVVDLSVIFGQTPSECVSIANVIPGTITGNSDTADYKDTVLADITDDVTISNCGSLTLTKTDDLDEPLQGAVFSLYESDGDADFEDDDDVVVATCTTDEEGICEISDIFFGEYWLDETTVPEDHDKASGLPTKVTISGTTTVEVGTFVNPRQRGSIIVEKVLKGTDTRIDGATFVIDDDGDLSTTGDQTVIPEVEGATGLFCIDDLTFGDYEVGESAAPSGYNGDTTVETHTVDSKSDCETRLDAEDDPDLTFENEKVTSLVTSANQSVVIGNSISDTATLSGGVSPTGTISFALYDNSSCTGTPVFTDTKTVNGNGGYTTSYTPLAPDTYYWMASYGGDGSNSSASHDCAAAGEVDTVIAASPAISTSADETVTIGSKIHDTASITGGYELTGTVDFALYSDDDCSVLVTTFDDEPITASPDGTSATAGPVEYTPTAPGTYYWIASYSGDTNNNPIAGECGDTGETDVVNTASPAIVTTPDLLPNDSATLSGGFGTLGGTITFELHDSDDCLGEPIYSETVDVTGTGTYGTNNENVFITADGIYSWLVTYSGDANNEGAFSACDAEQAQVDFTPLAAAEITEGGPS